MQRCILEVAIRTRSSIQEEKATGYSISYKEVTIQCDESSSGLGVVLMQDKDPIGYASVAQNQTMHRLRKNIWQLYLYAQNLIYMYMTELWSQFIQLTNL